MSILIFCLFPRLFLVKKRRYITAEVRHFENGPVITASSAEWAIKKQLYRYSDLFKLFGHYYTFIKLCIHSLILLNSFTDIIHIHCRGIDGSAYINVARVLAQRCLESGICEMEVDSELIGEKCELFIKEIEQNGIILKEPPVYQYPQFWAKTRPEKPWEIHE